MTTKIAIFLFPHLFATEPNFAEARKWAKENLLGTYINPEVGEIVVSGKAIDKYLSQKAVEQSQSLDAHLSALQVLPQLIENSIVGEVHEDRDENSNIKDIVRLFGAINIGNETSRVKITVKRYSDKNTPNKAYSYEVTEIEPLDGHWTTHTQSADFVPTSNNSITGAKLLKGVENSKGLPILNSSKVVDENGEPMVAYHSGNEGINAFSREFDKQGIGRQFWGKGFYFGTAKSKDEWSRRYKNKTGNDATQYAVYLNIKNPIYTAINGEVKDSGYDGVIIPPKKTVEGETDYMYIVADPTQIKSATDNVGAFDVSNPDIRYSVFGGNSGYDGYSMSKRASRARDEGRFPKTDFKKEYGVSAKSFDALVDSGIIASGEWHHTSMYGNKTDFYHWEEDYYADIYEDNKKEIDKLSREHRIDDIISLFENHPLTHKAEYDRETERDVWDIEYDYNGRIGAVEKERRNDKYEYNKAVFDALGQLTNVVKTDNGNLWFNASNGVSIQLGFALNEMGLDYRGANTEGGKGALKNEARSELESTIEDIVRENNIKAVDETYYADKTNQLEAEKRRKIAQFVKQREKEYTPKARHSLRSDMAKDEQMQSLIKDTPLWEQVKNSAGVVGVDDNDVAEEVLNRLDEDVISMAWDSVDSARGVFAKAEATDIATRLERALQMMRSAESGISEGEVNPIAEKEVENVIVDSSEIKLPTNRAEALDVVSKMKRPFINHDQNKEIIVSNKAVRHAATQDKMHKFIDVRCLGVVDKIIENAVKIGNIDVDPNEIETTHKVEVYYCPVKIDDTQYSVRILVRQLKNKGRIMEDFRMYDLAAKDKKSDVSSQGTGNESLTPLLTSDFAYKVKDLIHNSQEQDKKLLGISNKTKFSLQGGRSIAGEYKRRVNTKGKGGAMHLSKFNFMEAWQDEMRALKEVQRIIEQEYGIKLASYEDAYMAENAMSSAGRAAWEKYVNEVYEPMMKIHDEWIGSGESNESINHYLIAKSGLERNREFTVRDALTRERKEAENRVRDAYRGAIAVLNNKYSPLEFDLFNQYRSGAIDEATYKSEREKLLNAKRAERKPIDDKYQLDMQDVRDQAKSIEDEYKAKRNALRDDLRNGNISFAEFNQLSDELALQYSGAEEIKDYSGLTALAKIKQHDDFRDFAEEMVTDFESRHSNTEEMWERIRENTKAAVDYSYKSGITSKQAKEHLDQMFEWYVPMKGNSNTEAEDIYTYVNDKSSSFTPTVQRAKGHTEYVSEDVPALIANTMQSAILQGERNNVIVICLFDKRQKLISMLMLYYKLQQKLRKAKNLFLSL